MRSQMDSPLLQKPFGLEALGLELRSALEERE